MANSYFNPDGSYKWVSRPAAIDLLRTHRRGEAAEHAVDLLLEQLMLDQAMYERQQLSPDPKGLS